MIRRPAFILALLTSLNLLNYLDRYVLSAVLTPIEHDLDLSHAVSGFLGTIFLIGYFATSPLFGALADRGRRTVLIAVGILIWSLATIASGLATSALTLAAARVAVGVGEASYATIAPTIIDDLAPAAKKGTWLAVFYSAAPIGSALGYVVGGNVEAHLGWRAAFFVSGGPGLVLAALSLLMVDPPRKEVAKPGSLLATIAPLAKIPLYVRAVLGYAAFTFAIGGFGYWGPTYLFQRFGSAGLTLAAANNRMGIVTVVGGALGTAIGGFWADRATKRMHAREVGLPARDRDVPILLHVCAVGSLLGAPLAALAILAPTDNTFFVAFLGCEIAVFLSTSPINAAVLASVPASIRASAMAVCIFGIHILGDLWSPPGVGILADHFSMRTAMLVLPVAILASAVIWWPPSRPSSTA